MKRVYFVLATFFLVISCRNTQTSQLMNISVDINQKVTLSLSLITEEITAIELELSDESITSPERVEQVLFFDNNLIIVESRKILVFDMNGNFIRTIGSKGQGPREYYDIRNMTIDEKNGGVYVVDSNSKILCYDLNGNYLKGITQFQQDEFSIIDLKYINDDLLLVVEQWKPKANGVCKHSAILKLNDELQITDSCMIRDDASEKWNRVYHSYDNYLFYGNSTIYLYYPDLYAVDTNPAETVLRDTLYRFEKNQLIPELKLKFNESGIEDNKNIYLFNIYRSSGYVFAVYYNKKNNTTYRFIYDTDTGKGYNVLNGEFTDDMNQIEEQVKIRPVTMNTELFYYLHTHMKPDDIEEPNPTLYIGKLKK